MTDFHERFGIGPAGGDAPVSSPEVSRHQSSAYHGSIVGLNDQMHRKRHFLYVTDTVATPGVNHELMHEIILRKPVSGMSQPWRNLGDSSGLLLTGD